MARRPTTVADEEAPPAPVEQAVADNEPPAAPAPVTPIFSAEGVLLNPQDCVVGPDGVVRSK